MRADGTKSHEKIFRLVNGLCKRVFLEEFFNTIFLFVVRNGCLKKNRSITWPHHLRIVAGSFCTKEVFGGNLNVVKSVCDIKWFEDMENDWRMRCW